MIETAKYPLEVNPAADKKKIVIVEDDPLLAQTINLCLSKKGHDVSVFYSGADAVKHLLNEKADSMVIDIRLPDCDGWFIAKLTEKFELTKKVPLIMMSVLEPDRQKVSEFKPYAYVQKPFDMGQLMQTVEASLGV